MIFAALGLSKRVKRDVTSSYVAPGGGGGGSGDGPVAAAPTMSSAGPGTSGQAVLAWFLPLRKADNSTLPSGDIVSYSVRRYSSDGLTLLQTYSPGNVLSYTASGISAGTYRFTVSCTTTYGESEESFQHSVTVS